MKKNLWVVMMIALTLIFTGCSGSGKSDTASNDKKEGAEPILIKFTHVSPEASTKGKAVNMFRDLVDERLGDKVKVEVYPSSQLFGDADGLEALQAGNIQMMFTSNSKLVGLDPAFQIADLPFFWKDEKTALGFLNGPEGQAMGKNIESKNVKVLATWFSGYKQFSNNKHQITKPEDFKGIKFRIMSGGLLEDQFTALGAGAQVIPFSELYIALQRGTVDGQENPVNLIDENKYYEVQKYLTLSNHAPTTHSVLTNPNFWNGLPADIRTELEKIMTEVTEQEVKWAYEDDAKSLKIIEDAGMETYELTPADYEAFRTALEPVYAKYENIIGKELMEKARAANKQ